MTSVSAFLFGLLQGFTEFIPVSSSGHLVLFHHFFSSLKSEQSFLWFDILLHSGSFFALVFYFFSDWKNLFTNKKERKILYTLCISTLPVIFSGFFLADFMDIHFRTLFSVSVCFLISGVLLFFAEQKEYKNSFSLPLRIFFQGIAQAFAIFPGISRSGITLTAGLFSGMNKIDSAKYSFLLGTISLFSATGYMILKFFFSYSFPDNFLLPSLIGFSSSFFFSTLCIHYFLSFLQKFSLRVFAYYLLILGSIGVIM
jgi:undecaprenyl-diphosphatase